MAMLRFCYTWPKEVIVTLQNPEIMLCIRECHLLALFPLINLYEAARWGVELSSAEHAGITGSCPLSSQGKKSVPLPTSQPLGWIHSTICYKDCLVFI